VGFKVSTTFWHHNRYWNRKADNAWALHLQGAHILLRKTVQIKDFNKNTEVRQRKKFLTFSGKEEFKQSFLEEVLSKVDFV